MFNKIKQKNYIYLLILVSFFSIFYNQVPTSYSSEAIEIKNQISEKNDQIKALEKEIAEYQNKIAKTSEEAVSLSKIIKELNLTKDKLIKERSQIEKKINVAGLVIKEIDGNILTKEEIINNSKYAISDMIYTIYQEDKTSIIYKLLSKKDLKEFSRIYNDLISLNDNLKNKILELNGEKEKLNEVKLGKLDEQEKLTELQKELIQKEKAVLVTQKEKNTILNETKNKESEYQKLLAEKEKKRDEFENELREYESKLQFILNPKSIPKEGSEVLVWPLDSVLITSVFGERWGRYHYGLDFRASVGTKVKSMQSGVVVGTGDTDIDCKNASFGKWVFIKHDNGLSSTYAHLSSINVKVGQKIKKGEAVGLSGNTGFSTAPHLHISVYASDGADVKTVPSKTCSGKIFTQPIAATDAHLNPILYLPKTTKSMYKEGVL